MRLEGLSEPQNTTAPDSAHFKYFWIHGNGNFTTNTMDTFIHARYLHALPGTSGSSFYSAKVYSTSVYRGRGNVPTKMEGQIFTDTTNYIHLDSILTTPAVKSGYLNLQFNHNEIVPGDTTLWVLSIKNTLKDTPGNEFPGEVYLFFNSPIKVLEKPIEIETTVGEEVTNANTESRVKTKNKGKIEPVNDQPIERFSNFVFQTDFVYNNAFHEPEVNIDNRVDQNGSMKAAYRNGIVWHFDTLFPGQERHLFIEFEDADNIFLSEADSTTRIVDFLAVVTTNSPDTIAVPDLNEDDLELIETLGLEGFVNEVADSVTFPIFNDDVQLPIDVSRRIIDVVNLQPLAKRAHDPNQLTIQACACPPETDGAQKLIFTAEFENDGEANAIGARIAIALDSLIDPASIDGSLLAFYGPDLSADEIDFSFSEDKDSIVWTLEGINVFSTKEVGVGHPSTYGQITFTALTKHGANLEEIGGMEACIQFVDMVGLTGTVCTQSVKPNYLSPDESKSLGTQEQLQCVECVFPGCQFPLWLIFLIVLVIGFAIWIAFDNS